MGIPVLHRIRIRTGNTGRPVRRPLGVGVEMVPRVEEDRRVFIPHREMLQAAHRLARRLLVLESLHPDPPRRRRLPLRVVDWLPETIVLPIPTHRPSCRRSHLGKLCPLDRALPTLYRIEIMWMLLYDLHRILRMRTLPT